MKLHQTSEETQMWVKGRRKSLLRWTGWGGVVAIVTVIGFRSALMDQLDWFVEAMHGPSNLLQLEAVIGTVTNNIQHIEWHETSIDKHIKSIDQALHIPDETAYLVNTNKQIDP